MASEAISHLRRSEAVQSAQRSLPRPKSYLASAEQCAQNLPRPVMQEPHDQYRVMISPALAAMLRNAAIFLQSTRNDAGPINSNLNCTAPEMTPTYRHTNDKKADRQNREYEQSFLRAPAAAPKKGRGNYGECDQGTVEASASCADAFGFIGKEVGTDLLARNAGLFLDLENANQWNAILSPARDGALIDRALPGKIGLSQALFGEQQGER